jgi:type 1 fimbriae regulatory protein FimB
VKNTRKASSPASQRPDSSITFLTQDEVRRLFSVIKSKRDRAIFAVAYRHGLRASEVGLLQRTDVDFKQGRIVIHRLKGSLSGVYPMKPDTVKLLRSYLRERTDQLPYLFLSNRELPIDRRTLYTLMRKYSQVANIPAHKRKFHALKHSIATHILDAGEDAAFCRDWLGHKNIQNTMIYARFSTSTRDARARSLFASHQII